MLPRVLEPEVMDSMEEALDYDSMDHSLVNQRFVSDLFEAGSFLRSDDESDVLDLGTGTAQIPIELCRQTPGPRIIAVDMALSMLDVARANIEIAGLNGRVQLDRIDAKNLPYESGSFRCVVSNSIVHHIPEPAAAIAESIRVLSPGGLLFFRDLARPASDAEVERFVESYAGEDNGHQQKMFADSLRAALTVEELQSLIEPLGAPLEGVSMTSDRHWTWTYRKPIS